VADIGPALVTGGATIVGVVAGAGLTYWLGALNRRHQEEREDKTRWYEARLQAYIKLFDAMTDMTTVLFHPEEPPPEARWEAMEELRSAESTVHLVGSPDFFQEAEVLIPMASGILEGPRPPADEDKKLWMGKVLEIKSLARHDLGYPDTWRMMVRWSQEYKERKEREKRAKKQ
jgi:hypothetical protein